jgi:hypothetical protein
MDPNDLRDRVEKAIEELIEPVAWERCETVNNAEHASIKHVLKAWARKRATEARACATPECFIVDTAGQASAALDGGAA